MLADGWITLWRPNKYGEAALYEASYKTRKMITDIYQMIELKVHVSENPVSNPLFKKDARYSEKAPRPIIRKMNRTRKEIKRLKDIEDQKL